MRVFLATLALLAILTGLGSMSTRAQDKSRQKDTDLAKFMVFCLKTPIGKLTREQIDGCRMVEHFQAAVAKAQAEYVLPPER